MRVSPGLMNRVCKASRKTHKFPNPDLYGVYALLFSTEHNEFVSSLSDYDRQNLNSNLRGLRSDETCPSL